MVDMLASAITSTRRSSREEGTGWEERRVERNEEEEEEESDQGRRTGEDEGFDGCESGVAEEVCRHVAALLVVVPSLLLLELMARRSA